jgi:hypothetical protein
MRFIDIVQSIPVSCCNYRLCGVRPSFSTACLRLHRLYSDGLPPDASDLALQPEHSKQHICHASTLLHHPHVLPNSFPRISLSYHDDREHHHGAAMLSFIGLTTPISNGLMIAGGRNLIRSCPWMVDFRHLYHAYCFSAQFIWRWLARRPDPKLKK